MRYTADDLIAAVKRNGSIPSSQNKFQDADFLAFLNEELGLTIMGELMELGQDYFVTTTRVPLVASTSEYDLPSAAIGWKIETIGFEDTAGAYRKIDRITRSQRGLYGTLSDGGSPVGVYIEGNKVHTVPEMGSAVSGSLVFDYVRIQNELVKTSSCGLITLVQSVGANYLLTVGSIPATAGGVDVISGTNPFNVLARGKTAVLGGFVITVSQADFERVPVVGDYVAPTGKTPIPNIPEDFHACLAQAAAIRCLISLNDQKGLATAQLSLGNMFEKMRRRASRRINSSPKKIVSNSRILNLMRRR